MNQLHGRIDIRFAVKGTKGKGMMRFRSVRRTRMGYVSLALCEYACRSASMSFNGCRCSNIMNILQFQTKEWSLETEDGRILQLLDEERADPFRNTALQAEKKPEE